MIDANMNQVDRATGIELLNRILAGVRYKQLRTYGEQDEQRLPILVSQQLSKLLDTRRFIMLQTGMSWGDSGSIVISPKSGGFAVGLFICGYPQPSCDEFMARNFKVMQGAKLSSIEVLRNIPHAQNQQPQLGNQ